MFTRNIRAGFTLIELLLVMGMIAVLAGIVIVSVNPAKQLADARNAQRESDVNAILNAVYQYSIDHNGSFPPTIGYIPTEICKSGVNVNCASLINLNMLTGSYIGTLPNDPKTATLTSTNYTIMKLANRITVAAPGAEEGETISVTR